MIVVYVAIICVIVATVSSVWADIKKLKTTSVMKNELIKYAQDVLIPLLQNAQALDKINKEKEELFIMADNLIHSQETHIEDLKEYIKLIKSQLNLQGADEGSCQIAIEQIEVN